MQVLTQGADLAALGPGSRLLTEGFHTLFYQELIEAYPVFSKIFQVKESRKRSETSFEYIGLTQAQLAAIGGPSEFESPLDGGTKNVPMLLFKRGFQVAEEDEEDDLYDVLGQVGMDLPKTFTRRVESLTAGIFAAMFTSTIGFDGQPIASLTHPFPAGRPSARDGATVWANRPVNDTALSPESLATLHSLLRQTLTREGMPAGLRGKTLVVPVQLEQRAWEMISSMYKAFTDTNERNANSSGGLFPTEVVSWEWLPSPTMYALLDPDHSPFEFYWRRRPQFRHQTDINNGIRQYYGRMRCNGNASEPRGVAATPGA